MSNGLTVIIPCKNEIKNIRDCVESVRALADEILVADSGSTDGTLEWVRSDADCRVVEREFVDSGDFKNWAIPQATHPWVFILDADERIPNQLATEIRQVLQQPSTRDAYWIYRRNYYMGHPLTHTSWGRDKVIRLFQRDRGRYLPYTDHSEIELPSSDVGTLQNRLLHFSCRDFDAYLNKMIRYAKQQSALWVNQGRRPSFLKTVCNGPLRFLRSYIVELGILDGVPGFHVSMLTGFYSFLKQLYLWQHYYSRPLVETEIRAKREASSMREHRETSQLSEAERALHATS